MKDIFGKKFKEYGLRKLNSILDYGNLMIITKTPTIADDDCYNEANGYIEFILLNEFDIIYILEGDIYIHHYTEDEEYVATYRAIERATGAVYRVGH